MFAAVIPNDITRRLLSDDDKRGLCAVYPVFDDVIDGQAAGGCATARASGNAPAGLALAATALVAGGWLVRRRRRAVSRR